MCRRHAARRRRLCVSTIGRQSDTPCATYGFICVSARSWEGDHAAVNMDARATWYDVWYVCTKMHIARAQLLLYAFRAS